MMSVRFGLWILALSLVASTGEAGEEFFDKDLSNFEPSLDSMYRSRPPQPLTGVPEGQRDIVTAQDRQKGANYLEVRNAVISKILPDDTNGSPHQKWIVTLANGRPLLSVYNSDMGERIPLKVGDMISMGGQYIWNRGGGLIHWLHFDPKGRRPDGWVELNGVLYGTNKR